MEVAGSDEAQVNGEAMTKLHGKENGKVDWSEPIKFGSHGVEEKQVKGDAKNVSEANVPTNAVDEWPDAPIIHSFYFVKYRPYEDPILKAKTDQVDREITKINQRTSQIIEQLKPKRAARAQLKEELMSLAAENSQYGATMNEKRQEMKPLQDALGTLRGSSSGVGICSTEEELNALIRSLEYKMQHESLSLKEEKQLLREMKEWEATRPKVIANAARRAQIQESLGKTEVIQDQVKLLGTDMDGVRKQRASIKARMDQLGQQVKALDEQINPLRDELTALDEKRKKAFDSIKQLRNKRDEGNASFFQNRNAYNSLRELAAKKDLKGLENSAHEEVEKFMFQWNSSKAFRGDYEKRILMSLDMRQFSRDGRIRNPEEKPLVIPEAHPMEVAPKAAHKPQREEPKSTAKVENSPAQKVDKESKKKSKESKTASERAIEEEEVFVVEKPKKMVPKENEIDQAKMKEMKREEEKEKQRQALERKKKLQEKTAAKAALRAQKEAEKKQKEREKKLKKKEGTSAPSNEEEPSEIEAETAETEKPDNIEEGVETSVPPSKAKEQNNTSAVRYRKQTAKTRGTLPKTILKKKKNDDYWIWASAAAAAASVVVVILLALGYNYLL